MLRAKTEIQSKNLELNKVHLGDCLELMKKIPSKSIDMILCDLPYGETNNPNDIPLPLDIVWAEYNRIIKPNGCIALFAQGLFYVDLVNSNRKMFRYDLVWDKVLTSGFLNAKRMPMRQHEQIAIFYRKLPTFNPQFTQGKPLHSKGKNYMNKEIKNQNYGEFKNTEDLRVGCTEKYPTSILRYAKPHPSCALHRTEKSVECCEWLLKTYSNKGDIVLDNCVGSGTTLRACKNLGRNFIGIELNEKDYNISIERLKD
jgi:site-specific DNA-methyltransferase (adenine-specific)